MSAVNEPCPLFPVPSHSSDCQECQRRERDLLRTAVVEMMVAEGWTLRWDHRGERWTPSSWDRSGRSTDDLVELLTDRHGSVDGARRFLRQYAADRLARGC